MHLCIDIQTETSLITISASLGTDGVHVMSVDMVKLLLNAGSQINAEGSDVRVLINAGLHDDRSLIDAQTVRT